MVSFAKRAFQSTHPRRVRPIPFCGRQGICRFQSTHPRRVRPPPLARHGNASKFQSTHPRRVRPCQRFNRNRGNRFNPRTHVGCDLLIPQSCMVAMLFQSTHPRRVRPDTQDAPDLATVFQSTHPRRVRRLLHPQSHTIVGFNPRTHVGCDCIFNKCLNITMQR